MEPKTKQYRGSILVINDVHNISDYIARWLQQKGYRCTFVNSVNEAKSLKKRKDYDAIIDCQEFCCYR